MIFFQNVLITQQKSENKLDIGNYSLIDLTNEIGKILETYIKMY